MTILSRSDYRAALKETLLLRKSALTINASGFWYSYWNLGPLPAAGGAIGNATTGLVPVAGAGGPPITFGSGVGYITKIEVTQITAINCRLWLYDRLWHAGTLSPTATTTFASQPSFASRVPGGTDYSGLMVLYEQVVAGAGANTFQITYTNQAGTTGITSPSWSDGSTPEGNFGGRIPLLGGDTGVRKIESVIRSGNTGTVNVFVARPLWMGALPNFAKGPQVFGPATLGFPQIFNTSCLCLLVQAQTGGQSPQVEVAIEVSSF